MLKKGAKLVAFQGSNYMLDRSVGKASGGKTETAKVNLADPVSSRDESGVGQGLDVSDIAANVMPSLVSITNIGVQEMQNLFGQTMAYESQSSGTGIIIGQTDTELLIVTNNHVVNSAQVLSVGFADETACEAKVKGTDRDRDLAVIAVKMEDISKETREKIRVIELGRSSELQVGEQVIAIGNALGYGQSVTTGIVSALNRQVTVDDSTNTLIQTDAAINPGNSGGALLNRKGQLVGINSAKYSDTSVEGMGYAIPVDDVVGIIEGLMNRTIREEKVPEEKQGFLGITGQDVTLEVSEAYDMPRGIYITSVEEGSAAEKAGLKKGNIIAKFDGASVSSMGELKEQLSYYKEGEEVTFAVWAVENGQYEERTVNVVLGKRN